jgi:hypothetical protein
MAMDTRIQAFVLGMHATGLTAAEVCLDPLESIADFYAFKQYHQRGGCRQLPSV